MDKTTHRTHSPNLLQRMARSLDPRRSLRGQVSLLIAGVVLALSLLLSSVTGAISVRQTVEDRGRFLDSQAQEHTVQISRTMFERWREIQNLAAFGPFNVSSMTNAYLRSFLTTIAAGVSYYSWIGYVSLEGDIIASSGALLESQNVAQQPWFQQGLLGPYAGDMHEARLLAELLPNPSSASLRFVAIAAPVYENGVLKGVLGAHMDWYLAQEIVQVTGNEHMAPPYDDVDILVVNGEGVIVAGPPQMQARLLDEATLFTIDESLTLDDAFGHYQVIDWPGEGDYLTGYSRDSGYLSYPGLGWLVIVRQPVATASMPARNLQQQIIAVGLLSAVVFAVVGWWLAGRATRPLARIANAVRDVQDSTVDIGQLQLPGRDEVSVLAQALHTLVSRVRLRNAELETLNATLEQQVAERTAAAENRAMALAQEIQVRQAVEESLRESEKRFRLLAESSFEGLVIMSGSAIMDVNAALVAMFGYGSASELIGTSPLDLVAPESQDSALGHIQANPQAPYETIAIRKDGTRFPVEMRGRSQTTLGHNVRVTSIRDLTLARQAEEATRKRLEQLAALQRVDSELNARLDLRYVLNFALDAAVRLSSADAGFIGLVEDNRLVSALTLGAALLPDRPTVSEATLAALFPTSGARLFTGGERAPAGLSLLHEKSAAQMLFQLRSADQNFGVLSLESVHKDGFDQERLQFIQVVAGRIAVAIINARLYDASQRQLAQVRTLSQTLVYQTEHDVLTGLANRLLFEQQLNLAIERAHQNAGSVVTSVVDLDRFKQVNDSLGHAAGDALLQQVALRLKATVGDRGLAARVGGDEFALFVEIQGPDEAPALGEAIVAAMAEPYNILNNTLQASCSVGFSLYPLHSTDPKLLLRFADIALYQAKIKGRDTYAVYDPGAASATDVTLFAALEQDLRGAVGRGELLLYFQPQLDLQENVITGVEALARWQHPRFGMVSPTTFIPMAERADLIVELGEWVLREACRQCMAWHAAGYPLTVAINVSTVQLEKADFVERVMALVAESGLPPQYIELEITESVLIHDFALKVETLRRLRAFGLRLAIDDFGTGFSSLNYLRELPVSILKIDQSFISVLVEGSELEARTCAILEAIVTMAHALDMVVIAEGVEQEHQVQVLRSLKSDGLQGYLLSQPMRADDMAPLLAERGKRDA